MVKDVWLRIDWVWNWLRSSFWFLPVLIMAAAVGLAAYTLNLDRQVGSTWIKDLKPFYYGGVESARTVLSTIAGAMMSVAGTVFSITLVVLTLASSQFGARLLRNFMNNRINQIVLGAYTATFLYCLLILGSVNNKYEFVPNVSIFIAVVLTIINIFLLIIFIHQISVSIHANSLINDVGEELEDRIKVAFPERERSGEPSNEVSQLAWEANQKGYKGVNQVKGPISGYIRAIRYEELTRLCCEMDVLMEIFFKIGDYVIEDLAVAIIYSNNDLTDKQISRFMDKGFRIGPGFNSPENSHLPFRQLVEIAVRAMSPGINDPHTAMACIDRLTAGLAKMMRYGKFPSYCHDGEGTVRLKMVRGNFAEYVDLSFNQIRNYSQTAPAVLQRMQQALRNLYEVAHSNDHREAIDNHLQMIHRAAVENVREQGDLDPIVREYESYLRHMRHT